MSFGGALLAMSAVQGISQIGQGYAQKAEAKYNAAVKEGEASMIGVQQEIEYGQYQRLKGKTMATTTANIAKAGIMPSGSAMAVMLDTLTQIGIDQAYGKFNLEQKKIYVKAEADTYRRQGKQAVYNGYSNAFVTGLNAAAQYKMYKTFDTSSGAKGRD